MIAATLSTRPFSTRGFMLVEIAACFVIAGLVTGSALVTRELMTVSRLQSQITQIQRLDEAVEHFYSKFNGLPGDILAASAEREGLPYGNGKPAHSDGDGKISPCNLGLQWHLGCETALFWSHLSAAGYISNNFSADSRLADTRLETVGTMSPYLPQSPLSNDIFIAVWSTNNEQPSPDPQLPYGNYYEISGINGIEDSEYDDNANVITPAQAQAIDKKIDNGYPLTGRVVVNGNADWPKDAWGTYAETGDQNCVTPGRRYNVRDFVKASLPLCHLAVAFDCCSSN